MIINKTWLKNCLIPSYPQVIAVILFILLCAAGLSGLTSNASYRAYFDTHDPLLITEAQLNTRYAVFDSLVLLVEATDETLLSKSNLQSLRTLSEQIEQYPQVKSVQSFLKWVPDSENLDEDDQLFNLKPITDDPAELLNDVHTQPAAHLLINHDGRLALLIINVALPGDNPAQEVLKFVADIRQISQAEVTQKQSSYRLHFASTLALNEAYINLVRHDLKEFIPAMLIIFILSLSFFLGRFNLSLLILGNAILATIATFGIAGWFKVQLAAINAFTPVIIISLSIALSIHLVTGYCRNVANGESPLDAIISSQRFNFKALILSSLTTAAGFLLLITSPSPPVRLLGVLVAGGVLISFLLSYTLMSFLLTRFKFSTIQAKTIDQRIALPDLWRRIAPFQKSMLAPLLVITLLTAGMLTRMQINDNVYQYFPETHPFSEAIQLLDSEFNGAARIDYSIESNLPDGIASKDYQLKMLAFIEFVEQQPEVKLVHSFSQILRDKGLAGQPINNYLPLLKSIPQGSSGIDSLVTQDFSASRVVVFMKSMTTRELLALDEKIRNWLDKNITPYDYLGGVSPDLIFAQVNQQNAFSMFISLAVALIGVCLLSGWILHSFKIILITLLCNLLPLMIVFSLWTLLGGHISMGSAVVMGMITGVIIDDSLHMLIRFRESQGAQPVAQIYRTVGPAIVITSVTLCCGLIVGLLSDFRPIIELSGLSAAIIFMALIMDLLCLPALLNYYLPEKEKGH